MISGMVNTLKNDKIEARFEVCNASASTVYDKGAICVFSDWGVYTEQLLQDLAT